MTEPQITLINKHALLCTQLEETLSRQDAPTELIELRFTELSVLNTRLGRMVLDPLVDTKAISRRSSKAVKIISRTAQLLGQRSNQVYQAELLEDGAHHQSHRDQQRPASERFRTFRLRRDATRIRLVDPSAKLK